MNSVALDRLPAVDWMARAMAGAMGTHCSVAVSKASPFVHGT